MRDRKVGLIMLSQRAAADTKMQIHGQGTKAENKHGGTYGMLRDGEDRVFGELWRKSGPQARPNNFLIGSVPGYGGHVSAEIQWARKIDNLSSTGPMGLGSRRGSPVESALDLFQTRSSTPYSMRRLQMLQAPSQQQESYVSSYDKKGNLTRRLQAEQKEMCSWCASLCAREHARKGMQLPLALRPLPPNSSPPPPPQLKVYMKQFQP